MSEPNSGQWGKQDSGRSANPSIAHAADGEPTVEAEPSREPSDSNATHVASHAIAFGLVQPFTELQETMSRVTDQIAIQQDKIHKTLSSIKLPDPKAINMPLSAHTASLAQPTTELKERSEIIEPEHQEDCTDIVNHMKQDIGDIKVAIEKINSPSKLELTRKLVVEAVTLAMVIIELADRLWGHSDFTIIYVWKICTQYVVL